MTNKMREQKHKCASDFILQVSLHLINDWDICMYITSPTGKDLWQEKVSFCVTLCKKVWKVSAWHKVSKHLCWRSAVLRSVVGINISFSLSKIADAKVSYFYFNNKISPVDVKKDNAEIQKTTNYQYLCCKLKREWQKNVSILTETQPTTGDCKRWNEANSTSTLFNAFHLPVGFLSFLQLLFSRSHGSKTPFLGSKCKLVLPELPTHRMKIANESRSAPTGKIGLGQAVKVQLPLWRNNGGNLHRPAPSRHRYAPSCHSVTFAQGHTPTPIPPRLSRPRFHLKLQTPKCRVRSKPQRSTGPGPNLEKRPQTQCWGTTTADIKASTSRMSWDL